jgi:cell division protein FtsW
MEKKPADKILLIAIFSLVIFGLIMIFSASVVLSLDNFGVPYYYFYHQLFYGIIPGLILWGIIQHIDYRRWEKFAPIIFLIALLLLFAVLIPGIGQTQKGAARWIYIGSFNFQPAEIAKLALALYLAAWLASKGEKIKSFSEGFVPFVAIVGMLAFLIINQPDIGTLGVISLMALTIFFLARCRLSHFFLLIVSGISFLFIMIKIAPYRLARLTVFLNPGADPQGIGYQINQALLAIGSGGLWGAGLGHSKQKFLYLPEPIGDSIYAIIAEELGLLGSVFLLALFLTVGIRGMLIAKRTPDLFGKLLAGGITAWIVFQALINMAAITSLIPLTGVPLPFISYGSTALVVVLSASGILLNISKKTDP